MKNAKLYLKQAGESSPYVIFASIDNLPDTIDPSAPHTMPRVFMDVLGAIFRLHGKHLHFYKKF